MSKIKAENLKYITFRLFIFHGHNNRKTAGTVSARTPMEAANVFLLEHFENGVMTSTPVMESTKESRYSFDENMDENKWSVSTNIHKKRLYMICKKSEYLYITKKEI